MATEFLKLTKLTIYVGEDFFYKDKPFYKAIFDIAGKYKIAGCTVMRGTQGYGSREPGAGEGTETVHQCFRSH